jgi:hypothetical protein
LSNEIDDNDLQPLQHSEPRISTCRGIVMDLKLQSQNALGSISLNSESLSNEIDDNDLQPLQHSEPRIST